MSDLNVLLDDLAAKAEAQRFGMKGDKATDITLALVEVVRADSALADTLITWLDDKIPEKMGRLSTALMDSAQARNTLTKALEAQHE